MRMQVLHIGLAVAQAPENTLELINKLDKTWKAPLFNSYQVTNLSELKNTDPNSLIYTFN